MHSYNNPVRVPCWEKGKKNTIIKKKNAILHSPVRIIDITLVHAYNVYIIEYVRVYDVFTK